MQRIKQLWLSIKLTFAVWLAVLAGCATPTPPDVGAVVVAPKVTLPPVPTVVQQTLPRPVGFYQKILADYFSSSPPTPTK